MRSISSSDIPPKQGPLVLVTMQILRPRSEKPGLLGGYSGILLYLFMEVSRMMYPFMTLDDGTEIVHSEMHPDGRVKVYLEKPDAKDCFHHATCYLPDYTWEDIFGFTQADLDRYLEVIQSTAHLILQFSQEGGLENASSF